MDTAAIDLQCPCCSGALYRQCCQAVLSGLKKAETAEALMRSRYSAYVVGDGAYLWRTWHPSTRPAALDIETTTPWCGLEIIRTEQGRAEDEVGLVEFRATARRARQATVLHEVSRFAKMDGQWLYVDGDMVAADRGTGCPAAKVGRNDPCPCGSGRKFKKCCGR
jgi:SEC-C motif-containing protein